VFDVSHLTNEDQATLKEKLTEKVTKEVKKMALKKLIDER
jgi:hypothetical protein